MWKRILVWTTASPIPLCFRDWWEMADYIKQQNEAGKPVTIIKWEYT